MNAKILKLNVAGRPLAWISREEGTLLYCRNQVAWEAGIEFVCLRGGISRATGARSVLYVSTIVAAYGGVHEYSLLNDMPSLTNRNLFRRDAHMCMYCGDYLYDCELTRDHVVPVSRGGADTWENVVTACRICNHRKADRLLEECNMRLLALPYAPNRAEGLILENRHIMGDQMEFLRDHGGKRNALLYKQ
ncbi:MAG: HNH endonuclease [Pseudomonadota bacterium]